MNEYELVLQRNKAQLNAVKTSKTGAHLAAHFERGVVGEFSGVHKDTNSKTIKVKSTVLRETYLKRVDLVDV